MKWAKKQLGFTIVELLIVVVVIAILAAITVVAYNGINNRAKASVVASTAQQASKKVMAYAITNSDLYPTSLSDAGVSDGSATLQYRVDNTSNPKTFCITATTQNVSYFVSSTSSSPTAGACPGHAINGGTVVTNLFRNPGAVNGTTGHGMWTGTGTNTGSLTQVAASWTISGYAVRATWTSVTSSGDGDINVALNSLANLTPNVKYTVVYKLCGPNRSSLVSEPGIYASGGNYSIVARSPTGQQSLTANQVVTRWLTFNADATALAQGLRVPQTLTAKVANDYLEVGEVMIYQGDYDPSIG